MSAQLEVRGPQRDVHSGAVSGPAPNPVIELSRLLAQLHDENRMRNAGGSPASLPHEVTGASVIFFGTGLPEDHWHDSDESAGVDMLRAGAATLALLWRRLARAT